MSLKVQTAVLVRGLAHHRAHRLVQHGLAVRHHEVRHHNLGASHEVVLQILQADLFMQLARSGDDVLTVFLDHTQHYGVQLRPQCYKIKEEANLSQDLITLLSICNVKPSFFLGLVDEALDTLRSFFSTRGQVFRELRRSSPENNLGEYPNEQPAHAKESEKVHGGLDHTSAERMSSSS